MDDSSKKSPPGQKRSRSPNFPGIGLEEALKRVSVTYQHEKRNFAHVDTLLHHWGYKPGSGMGGVVLAALSAYGFITLEGSGRTRKAKVSDLGLRLLLMDPDEHATDRQRLLKDAALKPRIHSELWSEYDGTLPSDATLRLDLVSERGFTDAAAREFVPRFKETITYAGLTSADKLTTDVGDKGEASTEIKSTTPSPIRRPQPPTIFDAMVESRKLISGGEVLQFPIPLPDTDQLAALQVPKRMSEAAWRQMMAIINAYKPSIVKEPAESEASVKPASEPDPTA